MKENVLSTRVEQKEYDLIIQFCINNNLTVSEFLFNSAIEKIKQSQFPKMMYVSDNNIDWFDAEVCACIRENNIIEFIVRATNYKFTSYKYAKEIPQKDINVTSIKDCLDNIKTQTNTFFQEMDKIVEQLKTK